MRDLLVSSVKEQIALLKDTDWKVKGQNRCELLEKAPPVLWFGNSKSRKPKILTIGANPSRWEFGDKKKSSDAVFVYLSSESNRRFRQLHEEENLNSILENKLLQDEIIKSFDLYFTKNPYKNWFGHDKEDSYRVEGVLRAMNASYYEAAACKYQAIHIDLSPFPTITDFTGLTEAQRLRLSGSWKSAGKPLYQELIKKLNPIALLVFGVTNVNCLKNREKLSFESFEFRPDFQCHETCKCTIFSGSFMERPLVGLSVNLGNPRPFNKPALYKLGEKISKMITKRTG